jgi:Mannosyltransferase (PIG-V)
MAHEPRDPASTWPDMASLYGYLRLRCLHLGAPADRLSLGRLLAALVLSRALLFVVVAFATRILPSASEPRVHAYLGKKVSLAAWVRWDAWWYLSVAERGYWFDPDGKSSVAFFPLFPSLIRRLTPVLGNPLVAGLVLANLAAVGAVVALWIWVRREAGPEAAARAGLWLLVYPFAFFLHTVYAESLFFLLLTLSLLAARPGYWAVAGLLGALAAATRPMGVLLVPALLWGVWRAARGSGRRLAALDVGAAVLPLVGVGTYMILLASAFGDPLAFWTAHSRGWNVRLHLGLASSWREALGIIRHLTRVEGYVQLLDAVRVALPPLFLVLAVQAYRRLGPTAGTYAVLATVVATVYAPESVGRELLAVAPAFAVAGMVGWEGGMGETLRLCSFGLLFIFLFAFVTGHFVG